MTLPTERAYDNIKNIFERSAAINILAAANKLKEEDEKEVELREKSPQFTLKAKAFLTSNLKGICKDLDFSYDEATGEIVVKLIFK